MKDSGITNKCTVNFNAWSFLGRTRDIMRNLQTSCGYGAVRALKRNKQIHNKEPASVA